jgi:hypothetical protein
MEILQRVNKGRDAYLNHHDYESLHPFMDGTGALAGSFGSGRWCGKLRTLTSCGGASCTASTIKPFSTAAGAHDPSEPSA